MAVGRSIEREFLVGGLLVAIVAIGVVVGLLLLVDSPADPAAVEPAPLDVVHASPPPALPAPQPAAPPPREPPDRSPPGESLPRALDARPEPAEPPIPVPEGAQDLRGRVHNEAGAAVAGARIVVERGREQLGEAFSDGSGEFLIAALSAGHIRVTVSHGEYAESMLRYPRVPAEPLDVVLKQGGLVEGKVVDERSGEPISRASVRVGMSSGGPSQPAGPASGGVLDRSTRTDSAGGFRFDGLPVGRLSIVASAGGYAVSNAETVNLEAGGRVLGLVIRLHREGVIEGRVVDDQDGKPVPRALVVFRPPYPAGARRARTSMDGTFKLKGISPGMASIEVSRTGYMTRWVSGLNVAAGETVPNVEVRLQRPKGAFEPEGEGATSGSSPGSRGLIHDSPKLQYAGIGARLSRAEEGVRIQSVFPGSPAAQVGLANGDVIMEVDGQPLGNMELNQVVELIKGQEGRLVNLLVRHADGSTSFVQPVRQLLNL